MYIKHEIKLDNETPFKDHYHHIPPHQFEEVQKHLQDVLDIGASRHSCSPWASAVVLVWKKDGSLRFCIDLRHLKSHTIKDAYSLLRIEESLDCLNAACISMSLDLKSGYWQVEMDEKSMHNFYIGTIRVLQMYSHAIWAHQCPCHFSETHGILSWRIASPILHHLFGWHHYFLQNSWGTFTSIKISLSENLRSGVKIETLQMWIFQN